MLIAFEGLDQSGKQTQAELLRDPTHVRNYTEAEWRELFAQAGLEIEALDVPFSDIYKKFETESAAGGGPDLFIAPNDSLGSQARGGFLEALDGKIDTTVANSTDVSVAGSQVGGKLYMVPESLKAVEMYYDSAKIPTPPTTTDEMLAAVKGGAKIGMITGEYFGWGFYGSFGGQIFDANGKCAATATTGVADAMNFFAEMKKAGALIDSDYGKVNDAFKNGEIDAIFNGNWTLGDYKAARPAVKVAAIPGKAAGTFGAPLVGVDGYYINASSANKDLAIAVAQAMVDQAAQQIYVDMAGHVPANKNIMISDETVKGFSDAFQYAMPRPQTKELNNYWGNFGNAWKEVLDKGTDATTAVAKACADMDTANGK